MTGTSVFLHSTGTGPVMWDSAGESVLEGTKKLAPANLGYAPNPALARGTKVSAADDARAALEAIGLAAPEGPIHLFAHSYGGYVALLLAPMLGARLRSMFLAEPVLFGALAAATDLDDPVASAESRAFLDNRWFLDDEERGGLAEWQEHFIDYWNRPGSWQRMPEPLRAHSLSVGWKMFQEVRSCFYEASSFDAHALPDVPVTVVRAERSPAASRAMAVEVAKRGRRTRVVELSGTGHMVPLTHPDKLVDAMVDHVRWRSSV